MVLTCNDKYIFIIFLLFEFCILYTGNITTFRYFAEIPEHLGKPPQVKIFLIISFKKIMLMLRITLEVAKSIAACNNAFGKTTINIFPNTVYVLYVLSTYLYEYELNHSAFAAKLERQYLPTCNIYLSETKTSIRKLATCFTML